MSDGALPDSLDVTRRELMSLGVSVASMPLFSATAGGQDAQTSDDVAYPGANQTCIFVGVDAVRDDVDPSPSADCSLIYDAPDTDTRYYSPLGIEGWYPASDLYSDDDGRLTTVEPLTVHNPPGAQYHYPFGNRGGTTLEEIIQDSDGIANGLTNVNNTWVLNYAESGDGSSAYGELNIPEWGSTLGGKSYIAFTVEANSDDGGDIIGTFEGASSMAYQVECNGAGFISNAGEFGVGMQGDDGNFSVIQIPVNLMDGNRRRVVINHNNTDPSNWEVYINSSSQSFSVSQDNTPHTMVDFANPVYSHARNNQGSPDFYLDAKIDSIVPGDGNLTASEVTTDYNEQPWS